MKIGLGIITCNREHFFHKCFNSIDRSKVQSLIVVNDGSRLLEPPKDVTLIENILEQGTDKKGVGVCKNIALKYLTQEQQCDFIFLMEDDIFIKDNKVFDEYIQAYKETGIQHFNYALHGYYNLTKDRVHAIKCSIEYPNSKKISLYHNVLGAFSFYTRQVIEDVGLMDESYYNAMEHVDHTYQIIKKGYHPPFRWFADIEDSYKYLEDIVENHQESEIRKNPNWVENFKKACELFKEKNGFSVIDGTEKIAAFDDVKKALKQIKTDGKALYF